MIRRYEKTLAGTIELNLLQGITPTLFSCSVIYRRDSPMLYVPRSVRNFCSENMMVMERIYGIQPVIPMWRRWRPGHQYAAAGGAGRAKGLLHQVFRDSFFHADMHPGAGIFVSYTHTHRHPEDPQYIGIDCGIIKQRTKKISAIWRKTLSPFSTAIIVSCRAARRFGWVPRTTLKSLSSRSTFGLASRSLRSRWRRSPSATCCLICSIPRGVSIWKSAADSFLLQEDITLRRRG